MIGRVAGLLVMWLAAVVLLSGAGFLDPAPTRATPGSVTVGATAESPRFVVHAKKQGTADEALERAEAGWSALVPNFVRRPAEPIVIVVVEDSEEYERIQPAPMTRGFATFGGRHIYILGDQLDQEVVTHELVHILLGHNVRPGLWIPDWFNEGLAQWASGSRPRSLELLYTASAGEFLPLHDLDRIDALSGPDRQMATIEGVAVVRFLAETYGDEAVWDLVRLLGSADSFDGAIFEAFGHTDVEISDQWLAYAEDTYDLLSPAGYRLLMTSAFGLLVVLAVVAWFIRRASRSAAMALEPALTPDEIDEAGRVESLLARSQDTPPPEWPGKPPAGMPPSL